MKIICYAFKNQKGELEAPFLEYMEKYVIHSQESEKKQAKKVKQVMNIKAHLEYIVDNQGRYNLPPVVQKYKNSNLGIIKIKEPDNLVRIAFFTQHDHKIIFLDAYDKPKLYEKQKKQKIDNMIEKFLKKVEFYKLDYEKQKYFIPLNI